MSSVLAPAPTSDELRALQDVLAVDSALDPADAAALLDPRGLRFQRLEWLGDSLLDLVTAHHRLVARVRGAACCAGRDHARLVSDADLAAAVQRSGLVGHLRWRPSPGRRADLVEACVAAAWFAGDWPAAVATASTLVHAGFADDATGLVHGNSPRLPTPPCTSAHFREVATLGAYVLEAAAGAALVASDDGDEGRLTGRRHPMLAGRRLLHLHQGTGAGCSVSDTVHRVDHVQAVAGMAQLRSGAAAALEEGRRLLGI